MNINSKLLKVFKNDNNLNEVKKIFNFYTNIRKSFKPQQNTLIIKILYLIQRFQMGNIKKQLIIRNY